MTFVAVVIALIIAILGLGKAAERPIEPPLP
jgi:hypothetical protein